MAATTRTAVEVNGRIIELTNVDKVLWPDAGYTKADLIEYYAVVAPVLLTHLRGRPLSLTRHPEGIEGHSFYQKNAPEYGPEWLRTWRFDDRVSGGEVGSEQGGPGDRRERPGNRGDDPAIPRAGSGGQGDGDGRRRDGDAVIHYIVAEDAATLIWLANQNCIGLHPWLSTVERPDKPDQIVVDLDPTPPAAFEEARRVAFLVRDVLSEMGIRGYPKVSGATGIHIYIPVNPVYDYAVARHFAGLVGRIVADLLPGEATTERRVQDRGARVYVDHLQNRMGQTIAAPYSVRPRPGASVSTPVTWEELRDCRPEDFTIKTVPERVRRFGDLFEQMHTDYEDISAWVAEV